MNEDLGIRSVARAIFATANKEGVVEMARSLCMAGPVEIIGTMRTGKILADAGISHVPLPEFLSVEREDPVGSIKTAHPKILYGITMAGRFTEDTVTGWSAVPIDMVVTNFYSPKELMAQPGAPQSFAGLCDQDLLDIGGPAMLLAALIKSRNVAVVGLDRYQDVIAEIKKYGGTTLRLRKLLAEAATRTLVFYLLHLGGELDKELALLR